MNPLNKMQTDAEEKFKSGFKCLKFKIGALNWKDEFNLLKSIRKKYGEKIEIRVDANGAFNSKNVFKVLEELRKLKIHSIEQPIKPGNFNLMKKIVSESGVPIAFDEELIGLRLDQIFMLMGEIRPQYVILKPSLLGGMNKCDLIIEKAEKKKIGWWATSALESNIGLNAIAQWVSTKNTKMPQGLGTGALFKNNIASPLIIKKDQLWMSNAKWKMPF